MAEPSQVPDFCKILQSLHKASESGWDYFVSICQETRAVIGDFFFKDSVIEKLNVDFFAQQIVPSQELEEYVPLTVTGDGSCFYRSMSLLVVGDEAKHTEIRARCVIELALHSEFYLADEELVSRIAAQEKLLGASGNKSGPINTGFVTEVYRTAVIKSCNLYEYASMWQLQAVGAVLRRKIRSVYPETTPEVGHFF